MGNAELHLLYQESLSHITEPSLGKMIRTAENLLDKSVDKPSRKTLRDSLRHGTTVIDREEQLWEYLSAYGRMHQEKMRIAFNKLPSLNEEIEDGYSVVDWGCGQGLATVCFLDFLRDKGVDSLPEETILVEPSQLAIENARMHVGLYGIDDARLIGKLLDDVVVEDIETGSPVTIHLFSNILDVKGFDLKRLADLIGDSARGSHYFICVSPLYYYGENGDCRRLDVFKDYFINTVDYASFSESQNSVSVIAQEAHGKDRGRGFTVKLIVFKYIAGKSSVVQVKYYPPVQFFAAYQLDSVADVVRHNEAQSSGGTAEAPPWSTFEVAAPFELGGFVYGNVHPMLAVLSNIVARGLPTKCSPFVERAFEPYGEAEVPDELGSIRFTGQAAEDDLVRYARLWTPVGIARLQKTVLEAMVCGKLSMNTERWKVLVRERDVPCAALAFEDLRQMMSNLATLTRDYSDVVMPEVELTVVGSELYAGSPLHLGASVVTEADERLRSRRFDLVIDVSTKGAITEDRLEFSEFRARNNCYFVVGSSSGAKHGSARYIYTSDVITYLPLGQSNRSGEFEPDQDASGHLTYFLNLLFRKLKFREGQLPILNRALQNKNVIGLLPTGGGKSLTYQLAAMLQPGVTVVVDPLRSLMLDQYQGLREAGIDACAFINSTLSPGQRRQAEKRMESSQLQIVFLSPERLCIYEFRQRLETMHEMGVYFAYGVIDEVHCVSEWGHDFRFSYLHLGRNMYRYVHTKDRASHLTLIGLTATASFDVLADVERELSGTDSYTLDANTIVRYENTDRLELQYRIDAVPVEFGDAKWPDLGSGLPRPRYISKWVANDSKSEYLVEHIRDIPDEVAELQSEASIERIRSRFAERQNAPVVIEWQSLDSDVGSDMFARSDEYGQAGIVFCPHRDNTGVSVRRNRDSLAGIVPDIGTFVGSSEEDKAQDEESFGNLKLFKENKQPLMIATKAFGMGIDKPNVRFTVNMNYPSSLESFVQEAGRAGRDRRISLATILVGDYGLARVSPNCQIGTWPLQKIKGYWYNAEDLSQVLAHYRVVVPDEFIETASPADDWVKPVCIDGTADDDKDTRKRKQKMFSRGDCAQQCENYDECHLRWLPDEYRGWRRYAEMEAEYDRLRIPKTNLTYLNADYGNNMYFYNSNFLGERPEKKALYETFCHTETLVSLDDDSERGVTFPVPNLIDAVLSLERGQGLVAFVKYPDRKASAGTSYGSIHKAIYRMCCIGFVDDFTQDYTEREFRLVMRRKADGQYYEGLKRFLMRYYAEERAEELVAEVSNYRGENEVQKCLGFLVEFIYGKIAVKRKRALDDVRAFCAMGMHTDADWKETNEELKDHIYYYFNSKYARDEYFADTGEPFSLAHDTARGREGTPDIVLKYLRVVDDDLVGAGGTPIDNIKHLQGAVRLIRRSVTDVINPCLSLLNYFCLTQLGTNGSEALERELVEDYRAGMAKFAEEYAAHFRSRKGFWEFKGKFDDAVEEKPHRYDTGKIRSLRNEVTAQIHLTFVRGVRQSYSGRLAARSIE